MQKRDVRDCYNLNSLRLHKSIFFFPAKDIMISWRDDKRIGNRRIVAYLNPNYTRRYVQTETTCLLLQAFD